MSHGAAGETIHYQLIYPQELFVFENSIMVTTLEGIQTYLLSGPELCSTLPARTQSGLLLYINCLSYTLITATVNQCKCYQ